MDPKRADRGGGAELPLVVASEVATGKKPPGQQDSRSVMQAGTRVGA